LLFGSDVPSKHEGEERCEDSKENWINATLSLPYEQRPEAAYEIYRSIILNTVPKVKDLKARRKISDWHFRFGDGDVAFRLRSGTERKREVVEAVEQIAAELTQKKLVRGSTLKEDRGWIVVDDNEFRAQRRNHWRQWWWQIECDEILSELVYKVFSYQDYDWACGQALHDLFNKFTWQGLNGVFVFQPGKQEQVADLLVPESAKEFRGRVEWRKSRFIEGNIKGEMARHWSTHGSQKEIPMETREAWEAKYRRIWDARISQLRAMFLY
jgi:hypothetical protein